MIACKLTSIQAPKMQNQFNLDGDALVAFDRRIPHSGPVDEKTVRNKLGEDFGHPEKLYLNSVTYMCDVVGCNTSNPKYQGQFVAVTCSECGFEFDMCVKCRRDIPANPRDEHTQHVKLEHIDTCTFGLVLPCQG